MLNLYLKRQLFRIITLFELVLYNSLDFCRALLYGGNYALFVDLGNFLVCALVGYFFDCYALGFFNLYRGFAVGDIFFRFLT